MAKTVSAASKAAKPRAAASKPAKSKNTQPANPLLKTWRTPFGLPPFSEIEPKHYLPAFSRAFAEHRNEIRAIASATSKPTFANTIVALEKAGDLLSRVAEVFYNLASSDSTEALQAIERDLAPKFAAHYSAIHLNAKLYARIADLHARRDSLGLDDEQRRILERTHLGFVRAGAALSTKKKQRVAAINGKLAELKTKFAQNVLADEQSWRLVLNGDADLAGLPEGVREAAARTAADLGLKAGHAITLARSSVESFLQFSSRRDLREEAFKAWTRRGENDGKTDNRQIVAEIIALRDELAKILGYATFADFALDDTMAKTPAAVRDLLGQVWTPAVNRAAEERDALQKLAQVEGGNFRIAAWDWRYYAEKERKARFDLDDGEVRPYLQLDNMIAAAFDTASRLFGLKFKELPDAPRYHPDVRVWEVLTKKGDHVGIFLGDYFARPSKQSGAWMSAFRSQQKLGGISPIIVNVMNFARGAEGEPTLLSFDDARTLFHEFGHGLHGLLSDVTYPSLAGTAVSRDFVELPSQLYEHWLSRPEILERFAVHEKTGKPMPKKLLQRLKAARNFNQGFATVEFTSSALLDMELHAADPEGLDITAFEREALDRISMPEAMVMRHRIPHFGHIMGGYAAGYYSYMWSEVMDADAFAAFEETGDVFDRKTAARLKKYIYSAGNVRDPAAAYVAFRGRPPEIRGLLRQRGFAS